ncbi:amino acid adenylation domain-containing protein, partial [Undibacterium sp. TJN19]|uniref:non-ribosomal peptide synthetase n=1 Tax=Undibacterium sp. TJN19 TaxID=3413055 RepID=UPI003BF14513
KLRGFRIELGEIEQALRQHPGVEQVLVLAREDQPGERRLVAYVVAAETTETTATETTAREETTTLSATSLAAVLSEHLKGRVPDYAVPGAFVLLDAFPLNNNGKIDRARLPVPDTNAYAREHYQAPATALESRLVALWQANLGQTRSTAIGIQDNYFAIGGDSIRSISLVSAARAQGLQFAIKDLFAHPTIAELASVVVDTGSTSHPAGQGTDTAGTSTATTTVPFALLSPEEQARLPRSYRGQAIEDAYPLSMLQQGMWFHSMQNPDLSLYIDVVTYRLHLQWDAQCFDRCLRYLIEKHAVLRTVFFKQSGQYLQLVKETAEMPIRYVDSRHVAPAERQLVVRQWVEAEKNRGIPSADSLWRMTVHQFDDDMLQLTFVVHHAIMDGWSVAALYAEFCELVALSHDGKELPAIVKPPVHQHLIHLENQALGRGGDYWKEKFNTAKLPWWTGARKTPSVRVFCEVSDSNAASIYALSQHLKVSDRSIWCAIYLVLIATLSGSRDVVGSVVTHGRPEIEGAQDTLGLFLNTLPLRCDLNAVTWEKLITNTSQELERIYEHRHYPLAQLQVDTGLDFSATLFNYTNFHVENNVDKNTDGGFDENNFLLSVNVRKEENSGRYYCALNLEPGVFDAGFVQRIQGYVKNILGAIQAGPTQKINLSRLLQTAEIKNQLEIWNPARSAADEEHNVYQLITSSISDQPDSIAVVFGQQHYSYRALDRAASAIASHFEASGLGVGSRIGIALERSFEMLATVLACLKTGICYVPLDPQLPASRITYIAEDADLDLMTGDVTAPLAKTAHMPSQQLKSCILAASGKAVEFEVRSLHTAHLAYTIYTSGSTGKPKGVGVSHGNLINFVKSIQEQPGLQQSDRIFAVTTLSFDIAFLELFVPLAEGATVDIAHHDDVYDGKKIVNRLAAQKISCMQATPSSWKLMLDAGWQGSPDLKALVGGEALSAELAEKLVSRIDQLWNMYGPTETTIWSTTRQIHGSKVDIGKPLRNTTVYVLNEALDLLPTGVIGELYIGGDGVASGYVNRPGLTAARFIPNPFAGEASSGGRIYRTGDLVRYLENGNVEYIGRADQQVKVRGYRVELGEIEKTILQTSLVKDAVVVLRGDESGNQIIVAYLVTLDALDTLNTPAHADMTSASDNLTQEDAQNKLAQAIRDKLKTSLPDYMVPSAFVVMDEFPLTPNGKLDRKALPSPRDALVTASYVAADGEIEERIAAIWAQILKREKIGRYSNFFELGGHSLLITQLASRIEDEFEIKVALKDFYEFPTLCEIASRIQYLSMLETMDEDLVAELSDEEVLTILSELDEIGIVSAKNQPVANQS